MNNLTATFLGEDLSGGMAFLPGLLGLKCIHLTMAAGRPMLLAKLLGALATALAVLALVAGIRRMTPIDIYFLDGYFVVTPSGFCS
jgi:hypothetical protein